MKPFQTLAFIFSVFLLLFLLAMAFPENGVQFGKSFHLKFANINDYLEKDTVQYADITTIIENTRIPLSEDEIDSLFMVLNDSIEASSVVINRDSLKIQSDSLRKITYPLQYTGQDPAVLYPFFKKLKNLSSQKKLVRILHYGDSQIEADRMSSFIRNKMQNSFGGSGCGMVPAVPLYNGQASVKQVYSENWERYTGFNENPVDVGHNRYGALLSFVRPVFADTASGSKNRTWLSFSTSPMAYVSSRHYSDVSLFIQADFEPVKVKVSDDNVIIDSLTLKPESGLKKLKWSFPKTPTELKFSFSGQGFSNIYGVSLDNSWGVALDNIPLRGSSGLVFSKTDTAFLSKMYKMMDVGLIILQFGGNVVPYMKDNFSAYEKYFKRELTVIKRVLPGIPVIVIGPSDMSIKEKDNYITYPNLEGIRDAMKKATLDSGFVFWDMYEAMGGKNSMPSWVSAKPSLAAPDYVHFNTKGAKIIAEMFSNALLNEYNYWQLNASK